MKNTDREARQQVEEFDSATSELVRMIVGLSPAKVANEPEWDAALQGHSTLERMAAGVYTLKD